MSEPQSKRRTRIWLIIAIVGVSVATLVMQWRLNTRRDAQREAQLNQPERRAKEALLQADRALINRDLDTCWAALKKAQAAMDDALAERPDDSALIRSRLVLARRLGNIAQERLHTEVAKQHLQDAVARSTQIFDAERTNTRARSDRLIAARELADLVRKTAPALSAKVLTDAADSVAQSLTVMVARPAVERLLADTALDATRDLAAQNPAEAMTWAKRAIAHARAAAKTADDPIGAYAHVYSIVAGAADIAQKTKQPEALIFAKKTVEILRARQRIQPDDLSIGRALAARLAHLADLEGAQKNDAAALTAWQDSIAVRRALGKDPDARAGLVRALNGLGAFHSKRKADLKALAVYQQAVDIAAAEPTLKARIRLVAMGNLAQIQGRLDHMKAAKSVAADAYDFALERLKIESTPQTQVDAAIAGLRHARLLRARPAPLVSKARIVAQTERARLAKLPAKTPRRRTALAAFDVLLTELK